MKLKIVYMSVENNQILKELELTEEEVKALSFDIADIIEFHTNFIRQRVRQNIDKIVEEAVKPSSKLLSEQDKREIIKLLLEKQIFVSSLRELPAEVKKEIIRRVNLDIRSSKMENLK